MAQQLVPAAERQDPSGLCQRNIVIAAAAGADLFRVGIELIDPWLNPVPKTLTSFEVFAEIVKGLILSEPHFSEMQSERIATREVLGHMLVDLREEFFDVRQPSDWHFAKV